MLPISRNVNIIINTGLGFMLLYSAMHPMKLIHANFLGAAKHSNSDYDGSGYVALAIVFFTQAVANWFVPKLLMYINPKTAFICSSSVYLLFTICLFWPISSLLYVASCFLGLAASIMWGSQNVIIREIDSSEQRTFIGWIFIMYSFSLFIGNLSVYLLMGDSATYEDSVRRNILIVFIVFIAVGITCFITSPKLDEWQDSRDIFNAYDFIDYFTGVHFPLLSVIFLFSGLNITFYTGIYGNCIGYTNVFGKSAKRHVSLSGAINGLGQVVGSYVFGPLLGQVFSKRTYLIAIGCLICIISYILILVNIPDEAMFGNTDDKPKTGGNLPLAHICAFLLGFGDMPIMLHMFSYLYIYYEIDYTPAYAIFKCIQCIGQGVGFVYAKYVGLAIQMYFMIALGVVGLVLFAIAERL